MSRQSIARWVHRDPGTSAWADVARAIDAAWYRRLRGSSLKAIECAMQVSNVTHMPLHWHWSMGLVGDSGVAVLGDCALSLAAFCTTNERDYVELLETDTVVVAAGGLSPWAIGCHVDTGRLIDVETGGVLGAGLDAAMWNLLAGRACRLLGRKHGARQRGVDLDQIPSLERQLPSRGFSPAWWDMGGWGACWANGEDWVLLEGRDPAAITIFGVDASRRARAAVDSAIGTAEWLSIAAARFAGEPRADGVP